MSKKKRSKIFSFFRYILWEKRVLFSVVSSILLIIAPFLNWVSWSLSYEGVSEEETYNMFQLAGAKLDINISIFFAVCFFVFSLGFMVLEFFDYKYDVRDKRKWIGYVELLILVIITTMIVSLINNDNIVQYISYKDGEIEALEYWIEGAKGHCNRGMGPIIALVAMVLAFVARVGVVIYMLFSNIRGKLRR